MDAATPGSTPGMGNVCLPADGNIGSGDVLGIPPKKKKKKPVLNFQEWIDENREASVDECLKLLEKFDASAMKVLLGDATASSLKQDMAKIKALLWMYDFQTDDEKHSERTKQLNGVGFNGVDGEILTSFAKQVIDRNFLSPKQMEILRKKMPKYAGQMAAIANHIESGGRKNPAIDDSIRKWIISNQHKYSS